jgi:hypothetical protein
MRLPRKGPAYEKASRDDRVMRAHGLPTRYWDVTVQDGRALRQHVRTIGITRAYNNKALSIAATRQRHLLDSLLTEASALSESRVVVVGAVPTDELGMTLAAALMRRTRELGKRPMCISMRRNPSDDVTTEPDVVVLHNMTVECHSMRAQVCRDWLDRFDDTLRVVVVGGTDPYTFCHTRLFCPLDGAIYLEGELREDVQSGV